MIKALFRKQFAEVVSQFSRRSGTKPGASPKRGVVIFFAIFGILYLSLGFTFFTASKELLANLTEATFPLFFMIVGLIAAAIGLLGSVFNAYSTIFDAKDNEGLLSLPIPPHRIVFARVAVLTAMTLLYAGAVWLPALLAFLLYANTALVGKVFSLLLFLPMTLLIEAVTLGIAFVVALIARRVKNKKAVIIVFSFVLVLAFYFLYFRAQSIVTEITVLPEIPVAARYALFFFYSMGRASQGSPLHLLIVIGTAAAAFGLAYFLLSHFFVKFTTASKNTSKTKRKGVVKSAGRSLSLYKRELRLFVSSPAYVMNASFGVIFLIAMPIIAIVKADALRDLVATLRSYLPGTNGTALAAIVVLFLEGMCCLTAPCISMEGKRLYLLRALPIDATEVFKAKILLHLTVSLPGTVFASVTLAAVLGADALGWAFLILLPVAHALFVGLVGLCMNIHFPVLNWTDEITAVKSGASVLITVFGVMISTMIVGGVYFPLTVLLSDGIFLLIATVLYVGADLVMIRWLKARGKEKFERLG